MKLSDAGSALSLGNSLQAWEAARPSAMRRATAGKVGCVRLCRVSEHVAKEACSQTGAAVGVSLLGAKVGTLEVSTRCVTFCLMSLPTTSFG